MLNHLDVSLTCFHLDICLNLQVGWQDSYQLWTTDAVPAVLLGNKPAVIWAKSSIPWMEVLAQNYIQTRCSHASIAFFCWMSLTQLLFFPFSKVVYWNRFVPHYTVILEPFSSCRRIQSSFELAWCFLAPNVQSTCICEEFVCGE